MPTTPVMREAAVNGTVVVPEGTRLPLTALERMAMQGIFARNNEIGRMGAELRTDQEALTRQIAERLKLSADEVSGPEAPWQLDPATWTLVKAPARPE